jgi:hypothetical protein
MLTPPTLNQLMALKLDGMADAFAAQNPPPRTRRFAEAMVHKTLWVELRPVD